MKTMLLFVFAVGMIGCSASIPYSYAMCAAPLLGPPEPCFDSFMVFTDASLTERFIMEDYARNIKLNYGDWQMSNRTWDNADVELELPAIICTEFVADGIKQYRMVKWVDSQTISSFENHRDDSLCDKWLAPIDDVPEPEQDRPAYENCGPGTILQDGICVVSSEKDSADTALKWGDPFYENLPSPNLESIRDYDNELIYIVILVAVGIIGGVVGGVIFVIRRKRK